MKKLMTAVLGALVLVTSVGCASVQESPSTRTSAVEKDHDHDNEVNVRIRGMRN